MAKCKYTNEEMLDNLRLIAEDIGHMPTKAEYDTHPLRLNCSATYRERFGTWYNACKKSGCPLSSNQTICKINKSIGEQEEARNALLSDLLNAAIQHPGIAISTVIHKWSGHSANTYYKYFVSTSNIRRLLKQYFGIDSTIQREQKRIIWTKSIVEEEFKRIMSLLKRCPTWYEMVHLTVYKNMGTGIKNTYGSYAALLDTLNYTTKEYKATDEAIKRKKKYFIKKLRTAYKNVDKSEYTSKDWIKICGINKTAIRKYFGSIQNWYKEARIPIPKLIKVRNNDPSKEAFKILKKLARIFNRAPYKKEYDELREKPCHSISLVRKLGSWNNVLKAAGIEPTHIYSHTDEELIVSIQETAKKLKHVPRYKEYSRSKKVPSITAICKHFGSWPNALEAAGLKEKSAS